MKCFMLILLLLASACDSRPEVSTTHRAIEADAGVGDPCGDCNAGIFDGTNCVYPSAAIDLVNGGTPADTGTRQVFHTEDYGGNPSNKINQASIAADAVDGAVVIDQVYELTTTAFIKQGVMYTGGGIRRACTPHSVVTVAAGIGDTCVTVDSVAGQSNKQVLVNTGITEADSIGTFTISSVDSVNSKLCKSSGFTFAIPVGAHIFQVFNLFTPPTTYTSGIVIDSVLFDGAYDCNPYTNDWRYNNTVAIRGLNEVRNSWFYDTPSENLTTCGANLLDNIGVALQGSLTHKSCSISSTDTRAIDVIRGNYIEDSNLAGDVVMEHSEGTITFSANAGLIFSSNNVYRNGEEGVFGLAGPGDEHVASTNDCFAHFPRLIDYANGVDETTFRFVDDTLIDVGP